MEWRDEGVVLSVKLHGENAVIVDVLTAQHGRHSGLVRGGRSRRLRPVLQPGNSVMVHWRARLEDHLGSYTVELTTARAGVLIEDGFALGGLTSASSVLTALPEREHHAALFEAYEVLLDHLEDAAIWPMLYVRWELGLLQELGFGLDLSSCAVTGVQEGLVYVSPRSGRAVSADGAGDYKAQLLALPGFLAGAAVQEAKETDVLDGLALTGHFLEKQIFGPLLGHLPEPRTRLVDMMRKRFAAKVEI